jgi:hypothetical protein
MNLKNVFQKAAGFVDFKIKETDSDNVKENQKT